MRRAPNITPIYFFTSLSAGSGKATLLSNLSIYLNNRNQKIAIIDLDASNPRNLTSVFPKSIELREYYELSQLVSGAKTRYQKNFYFTDTELISYFPSYNNLDLYDLFNDTALKDYLLQLRSTFDFVFINLPTGKNYSLKVSEILSNTKLWVNDRPVSIIITQSDVNSIVEVDKLFRKFAAFNYQVKENTVIVFNRVFSGSDSNEQITENLSTAEIRNIFNVPTSYIIPQNAEFPMQAMQTVPFVLQNDTLTNQIIVSLYRLISSSLESSIRSYLHRETHFKECDSGALYDLLKPYSDDIYEAVSSIFFIVSVNFQVYFEESENSFALRVRLSEATQEHFNIYDDEKQYERFQPINYELANKLEFPEIRLQKRYRKIAVKPSSIIRKINLNKVYSFDDTSLIAGSKKITKKINYILSKQKYPSPIIFSHSYLLSDIPSLSNLLGIKHNLRKQYEAPQYAKKYNYSITGIGIFEIPTEFDYVFTNKSHFISNYIYDHKNLEKQLTYNTNKCLSPITSYLQLEEKKVDKLNQVITSTITNTLSTKLIESEFSFKYDGFSKRLFAPEYPEITGLYAFSFDKSVNAANNEVIVSLSSVFYASLLNIISINKNIINSASQYTVSLQFREKFFPKRLRELYEPYCENFIGQNKSISLNIISNSTELEKLKIAINKANQMKLSNCLTSSFDNYSNLEFQLSLRKLLNQKLLFSNITYDINKDKIEQPDIRLQPDLTEKAIYKMDTFKSNFASSNITAIPYIISKEKLLYKSKPFITIDELQIACSTLMPLWFRKQISKIDLSNAWKFKNILLKSNNYFNSQLSFIKDDYINKFENTNFKEIDTPDTLKIIQNKINRINQKFIFNSNLTAIIPLLKSKSTTIIINKSYLYDYGDYRTDFSFCLKDIRKDIRKPKLIINSSNKSKIKEINNALMPALRKKYTRIKILPANYTNQRDNFKFAFNDAYRLVPLKSVCKIHSNKQFIANANNAICRKINRFDYLTTFTKLPVRIFKYSVSNKLNPTLSHIDITKISNNLIDKKGTISYKFSSTKRFSVNFISNLNEKTNYILLQPVYSNSSNHILQPDSKLKPFIPSLLEDIYSTANWLSKVWFNFIEYKTDSPCLKPINKKPIYHFIFNLQLNDAYGIKFIDKSPISTSILYIKNIRNNYEIIKLDRKSLLMWAKKTTVALNSMKKANKA